jgi:hypothetical protein
VYTFYRKQHPGQLYYLHYPPPPPPKKKPPLHCSSLQTVLKDIIEELYARVLEHCWAAHRSEERARDTLALNDRLPTAHALQFSSGKEETQGAFGGGGI